MEARIVLPHGSTGLRFTYLLKNKCSQIRSKSRTNCFMFEHDRGEASQNIAPLVLGTVLPEVKGRQDDCFKVSVTGF